MKKVIRILIITIISILIIGGAVFAYLYLKTDIFKSNKAMFIDYSQNLLKTVSQVINDEDINNYNEKKINIAHEKEGHIDVAIQNKSENEDNNFEDTIVDYNGKVDSVNNKIETNLNIHYADDIVLPVSIIKDEEKYGITFKEIMKAYAVIENSNLKEFFEKLGINNNAIPNQIEIKNYNLNFSEEELNTEKNKYIGIIENILTEEDFSKSGSEEKVYSLIIKENKLKNIISEILKQMKEDEIILNKITEQNSDNNTEIRDRYIDTIDKALESIKANEVEEEEEAYNENYNLQENDMLIMISEGKNGTINASIKINEYTCNIDVVKDKIKISFFTEEQANGKREAVCVVNINKTKNEKTILYETNISFQGINNSYELDENIDAGHEETENKKQEYVIDVQYEISGIKDETVSERLTIVLNKQIDNVVESALGTEIKNNIKFMQDIGPIELTDNNSLKLNDLSKDQLSKTLNQVINKIVELNTTKINQVKQKNKQTIIGKIIEIYGESYNEAIKAKEYYEVEREKNERMIENTIENMNEIL